MAILQILKFPHPVLLTKCEPVTDFDIWTGLALADMYETMKEAKGIGLAANQVGMSIRAVVMEGPSGEALYMVNPEIVRSSIAEASVREGCLSAPGEFLVLPRPSWTQVRYQDQHGNWNLTTLKDVHSVAIHHEIEHLDGKTYLQHPSITKKNKISIAKRWGLR